MPTDDRVDDAEDDAVDQPGQEAVQQVAGLAGAVRLASGGPEPEPRHRPAAVAEAAAPWTGRAAGTVAGVRGGGGEGSARRAAESTRREARCCSCSVLLHGYRCRRRGFDVTSVAPRCDRAEHSPSTGLATGPGRAIHTRAVAGGCGARGRRQRVRMDDMSRKPPSQRHRRGRALGPPCQGPRGRAHRGGGDDEARGRADGRCAGRPRRCASSTRSTASTARAAPGRTPHRGTGTRRSSARTAARRSPRRPPGATSVGSSSPPTRWPSSTTKTDYWLGQQGRIIEPMVLRPAAATTSRSPGTTRSSWSPRHLRDARQPGRGDLLHLRQDLQRGGVRLPAVRARVRHQQPARLLQHVPRVDVGGAGRGDRHRQGVGAPRGRAHRRADRDRRPEPRAPTTHGCSPRSRSPRRTAPGSSSINPLREAGLVRFKNPQTPKGVVGRGHRAGRPAPADPGQRRPRAVPGARRAAAGVGRRRPRRSWSSTPAVSRSTPPT